MTSYYSNGQWMVGFDDNVVGEASFTVRYDYYTHSTIPGTHTRIASPQSSTTTLPAHAGIGRVDARVVRPVNAYRLTVTAPGYGGAAIDL